MAEIEVLSACYTAPVKRKQTMSDDELQVIIKRNLSHEVARFIYENLEKLPIDQEIIDRPEIYAKDHRIWLYIISYDELKRLKEIERLYMQSISK